MNNLRGRKLILIDTETTGFDAEKNQILEIGALVLEDLKIKDSIEIKIKHNEYTLSTKAMQINGIDLFKHEEEAISEEDAVNELIETLKNYAEDKGLIVVGQNVEFDIRFLEKMFFKYRKFKEFRSLFSFRKLDIMQVALVKALEGKLELEKQDLDSILKALEIENTEPRHRALIDCELEYKALMKLLSL